MAPNKPITVCPKTVQQRKFSEFQFSGQFSFSAFYSHTSENECNIWLFVLVFFTCNLTISAQFQIVIYLSACSNIYCIYSMFDTNERVRLLANCINSCMCWFWLRAPREEREKKNNQKKRDTKRTLSFSSMSHLDMHVTYQWHADSNQHAPNYLIFVCKFHLLHLWAKESTKE